MDHFLTRIDKSSIQNHGAETQVMGLQPTNLGIKIQAASSAASDQQVREYWQEKRLYKGDL